LNHTGVKGKQRIGKLLANNFRSASLLIFGSLWYRFRVGMKKAERSKKGAWKTVKIAETILRSLSEPILVLDETHRAVVANPAFYQTLQIAPGQLEGKRIQELIFGESGQPHVRMILEPVIAQSGGSTALEIVCVLPHGERAVFSVSSQHISFDGTNSNLTLVELHDITKEREAEDKIQALNEALQKHAADLEAANKELESFTHSASHDLRTPLRLMNKIAYLLLEDHRAQLPAGAIDKVEMILTSTREMAKLIEDLLDFSRVSREPMRKRRVDLSRLVREAVEELRDEQQGRQVEIVIEDLPSCQADRPLLKQVILNLLENALKFTRLCERARIRVGCTEICGEVAYFIRDNGVGFEQNAADSLFLAFHRHHKRAEFEGTGLGLALVRRIIDRHGGRIWAEGEIDEGSSFYFTLGGASS
jgi:signal transduction histidine kinase